MNVLIVDNNKIPAYWGAGDIRREVVAVPGCTAEVRRSMQEDLPVRLDRFDRVVISGSITSVLEHSPWISRLEEMIRQVLNRGTPLLGICYGHQLVARVLGGESAVRKAQKSEYGWVKMTVCGHSRLLDGLPKEFYSYSSHEDEVAQLPSEMQLTARSEVCGIQAMEHRSLPIYGIQFHPEKTLAEAEISIRERVKKLGHSALMGEKLGPKVYESKVSQRIFRNFIERP